MGLDPYSLCVCGSGKKLKFCECNAEAADIERVIHAIQGDQRIAAREVIDRVLATKPKQRAMLVLKLMIAAELNDPNTKRQVIRTILEMDRNHPIANAYYASTLAVEGKTHEALTRIYRALEETKDSISGAVQVNCMQTAIMLIRLHCVLPALKLLGVIAERFESETVQAFSFMQRIMSDPTISILEKELPRIDSGGRADLRETDELNRNGRILSALKHAEGLLQADVNDALAARAIAVLKSYLADPEAAAAWRKYGTLVASEEEAQVDAECLAQNIDRKWMGDTVDLLKISYAVKDVSALQENLASKKSVLQTTTEKEEAEGAPPPRAAFLVLDGEASEENFSAGKYPRIIGQLALFGRETDRPARAEFLVERTVDLPNRVRALQEIAGEFLGMIEREEILGNIPSLRLVLNAERVLPTTLAANERVAFVEAESKRKVLESLPKLSFPELGGKSMLEVASDPAYRIRLLGLLEYLEISEVITEENAVALRQRLGLSERKRIDVARVDIREVPVRNLGRVDEDQLDDEQFKHYAGSSAALTHAPSMRKCRSQIFKRKEYRDQNVIDIVYSTLASMERGYEEAIEITREGEELLNARGLTGGFLALHRLDLMLAYRELEAFTKDVQKVLESYRGQGEVMELLGQKLVRLGIIRPDGTLRQQYESPSSVPATDAVSESPLIVGAASAPSSGSKLWLPGMD